MSGRIARPALQVEELVVADRAGRRLVDHVSFAAGHGMTAIVGESGSGKTLIGRAILHLLPSGIRQTGGRIALRDTCLTSLSPARLREVRGASIGMVFQDPMAALNPALTIGTQLIEGLQCHADVSRERARHQVAAMLDRVMIPKPRECLDSYPYEFSGGMRQRILIASVMLLKPKLLIADEPTTALDTIVQREVLDLLAELARDFGTAVLLISHDLGLVRRYASEIVVLRAGRLIESGPCQRIFARARNPYTKSLVSALPHVRQESSVRKHASPIISAENVSVTFARNRLFARPNGPAAVRNAGLTVHAGETVGLVGASGSGKTTLARAMLGAQAVSAGSVSYKGADISLFDRSDRIRFRAACQMIFQDPHASLDPRMRVGASIREPLRLVGSLSERQRTERVDDMLAAVGLAGYGDRYPHQLSGGQRQRIAIARAVIRKPDLIVADEPVSALDITIQREILELLSRLQAEHGFACLFISHDLAVVGEIADRILVMRRGEIVESGTRQEVLGTPRHDFTRKLVAASPNLGSGTAYEGPGR